MTAETQHTPGPWKALNKRDPEAVREHTFGPHIVGYDGTAFDWVATCQVSNVPEWQANARLIAAAPLMLEALRGIVDWMPVPRDSAHPGRAAIRKAHEAIRAATGEDA